MRVNVKVDLTDGRKQWSRVLCVEDQGKIDSSRAIKLATQWIDIFSVKSGKDITAEKITVVSEPTPSEDA